MKVFNTPLSDVFPVFAFVSTRFYFFSVQFGMRLSVSQSKLMKCARISFRIIFILSLETRELNTVAASVVEKNFM